MKKLFTFLLALVASVSATLATTTEITVAKALEIGNALSEGAITEETYDIVGYVTQIDDNSFNTIYKNMVFWIADENNGAATNAAGAFKVYRGKPTQELKVGDKVSVNTKIQNYKGSIESVSSAPVNFLEESGGSCGNNVTWNLGFKTGVLTISGTGTMADYSSYTDVPWYDYRSSIESIVINDGVTSIGEFAFYYCSSLISITIPESVTSIGKSAFKGCSKLTSVTINSDAIINKAYTSSSSNLSNIFGSQVTKYIIGDNVKGIGNYAFYNCSSLSSITIPNSVISIGNYAFSGCSSLTSITIPNSVTSIGNYVFYNCSSLSSITIPNSVTSIGNYAFSGCSFLTSVTIPNSVTSIGSSAFSGCSFLTSVTIPESVISIGSSAFNDCLSLTSVHITDIAAWCNIYFGSESANPLYYAHNLYLNGNLVKDLVIPNNVTSIGDNAFDSCSKLTSITIPNSVKSIGANAFKGCRQLYSIYCYAAMPPMAYESSFENYNAYLYVPCESQRYYQADMVWSKFPNTQCISSENVITDEIVITPSDNEANVTWPTVSGAASYELVIKDKDGNIVCTLIFNANGQLTSIAFNAPSRNSAPAQTQSAGFSFTITGLDSGTGYDLTLTAKDNSGNIIEETTIPFHTDYPEGIEDVQSDEVQSTKVIKDGQVLILRNGKTYTMQGQEVK